MNAFIYLFFKFVFALSEKKLRSPSVYTINNVSKKQPFIVAFLHIF